jgi:general secretion pathway protein B
MSFILDALKKAESERNRAAGPVLMNVRIAPPRRRLPAWAWALGCVLLANLAVLAWLLLRTPQASTAAAAPAGAVSAATAPAATASSVALPAPSAASLDMPPAATVYATPPPSLPASSVAPPPATSTIAARPAMPPTDLATLPSLQDVVAAGVNLPTLVMNMHVYDPAPTQRYVLLNGLRLTEGEFTADGIKVEAITERGAVLDARGHRFLLVAGGG